MDLLDKKAATVEFFLGMSGECIRELHTQCQEKLDECGETYKGTKDIEERDVVCEIGEEGIDIINIAAMGHRCKGLNNRQLQLVKDTIPAFLIELCNLSDCNTAQPKIITGYSEEGPKIICDVDTCDNVVHSNNYTEGDVVLCPSCFDSLCLMVNTIKSTIRDRTKRALFLDIMFSDKE